MNHYRLRQGVTLRELPDGDAVVAGASDEALIVNASAHVLLTLLDEQRTEVELTDLLCAAFTDQDRSAVERDVVGLLVELQQAGIVERCGTAPSIA